MLTKLLIGLMAIVSVGYGKTTESAEQIHRSLITLDTHVDINLKAMTEKRHLGQSIEENQVDLKKMQDGGLNAVFFIVYQSQGIRKKEEYDKSYQRSLEMFDAINQMIKINSDKIELALTAEDVKNIRKKNKLVAMIGVENGYPIGTDLKRVEKFHQRGARYISLTHNGHSQFGDSNIAYNNEAENIHGGLSKLGRKLIKKLNEVGVMVDISHSHKKTMLQTLKVTKTPVIASHSSVRAICDHSRNLDDEQLVALKKNGGVIQIVALRDYIAKPPKEMIEAQEALKKKFDLPSGSNTWLVLKMRPEKQKVEFRAGWKAITKKYKYAGVKEYVDHIDYVVKKIGINHVGIASDFDGGGGIDGWDDASETLNVTKELLNRGYTQTDIQKIWGGNLLRVLDEVQEYAKSLSKKS